MKTQTIQTMMSKTKFVLLAFLVAFSFSCSTEDGNDGAAGPIGPAGSNGADGTDGNANVQTFVFDTSAMSGSAFTLNIPEITQDVINNDVVLGYITTFDAYTHSIPGAVYGGSYLARAYCIPSTYKITYNNWDGSSHSVTAGDYNTAKIIIIESSSTTTGRTISGKQQIYNELNQAGVDINDYHAVCDYYGIDY